MGTKYYFTARSVIETHVSECFNTSIFLLHILQVYFESDRYDSAFDSNSKEIMKHLMKDQHGSHHRDPIVTLDTLKNKAFGLDNYD